MTPIQSERDFQGFVIEVKMPYFGELSTNHYQYHSVKNVVSREGVLKQIPVVHKTKAVKEWELLLAEQVFLLYMSELNKKGKEIKVPGAIEITIDAEFADNRRRDLHNVIKIICDCVEKATGLNDKNFKVISNIPVIKKRDYGYGDYGHNAVLKNTGEITVKVKALR